jgi:ABC-type molybdate transport system permease subunit
MNTGLKVLIGVATVVGLGFLITRAAGASTNSISAKLANPPTVDGFWQLVLFSNDRAINITLNANKEGQIAFDETVSTAIPSDFIFPALTMLVVHRWNTQHTAVTQIGGRESVNPDIASALMPYDPNFVIPGLGSYSLDYGTGEVS